MWDLFIWYRGIKHGAWTIALLNIKHVLHSSRVCTSAGTRWFWSREPRLGRIRTRWVGTRRVRTWWVRAWTRHFPAAASTSTHGRFDLLLKDAKSIAGVDDILVQVGQTFVDFVHLKVGPRVFFSLLVSGRPYTIIKEPVLHSIVFLGPLLIHWIWKLYSMDYTDGIHISLS